MTAATSFKFRYKCFCLQRSHYLLPHQDFREKNTDHMRPDIVALLRSSDRAFVRQLIGMDPVAMFRWGILRATIRGLAAFNEAGRSWASKTAGKPANNQLFEGTGFTLWWICY